MEVNDAFTQRSLNLLMIRYVKSLHIRDLTLKCIIRCSTPAPSFRILDLNRGQHMHESFSIPIIRYRSGSRPFVPGWFSIRHNLLTASQEFRTSWILLHAIHGSIKMARFTIGREHLRIHQICHSSLHKYQRGCCE